MMPKNHFQNQLDESLEQIKRDEQLIMMFFPNPTKIEKTDKRLDKKGVDYLVTINNRVIKIDVKRRSEGCAAYWKDKDCPEIPMELWAVKGKKLGWLYTSAADFVVFVFEKEDSEYSFLYSLTQLRYAWYRNAARWIEKYSKKRQETQGRYQPYTSEAVFVPVKEINRAILRSIPRHVVS